MPATVGSQAAHRGDEDCKRDIVAVSYAAIAFAEAKSVALLLVYDDGSLTIAHPETGEALEQYPDMNAVTLHGSGDLVSDPSLVWIGLSHHKGIKCVRVVAAPRKSRGGRFPSIASGPLASYRVELSHICTIACAGDAVRCIAVAAVRHCSAFLIAAADTSRALSVWQMTRREGGGLTASPPRTPAVLTVSAKLIRTQSEPAAVTVMTVVRNRDLWCGYADGSVRVFDIVASQRADRGTSSPLQANDSGSFGSTFLLADGTVDPSPLVERMQRCGAASTAISSITHLHQARRSGDGGGPDSLSTGWTGPAMLATGTVGGDLSIWNPIDRSLIRVVEGRRRRGGAVVAMCCVPSLLQFWVATADRMLSVWSVPARPVAEGMVLTGVAHVNLRTVVSEEDENGPGTSSSSNERAGAVHCLCYVSPLDLVVGGSCGADLLCWVPSDMQALESQDPKEEGEEKRRSFNSNEGQPILPPFHEPPGSVGPATQLGTGEHDAGPLLPTIEAGIAALDEAERANHTKDADSDDEPRGGDPPRPTADELRAVAVTNGSGGLLHALETRFASRMNSTVDATTETDVELGDARGGNCGTSSRASLLQADLDTLRLRVELLEAENERLRATLVNAQELHNSEVAAVRTAFAEQFSHEMNAAQEAHNSALARAQARAAQELSDALRRKDNDHRLALEEAISSRRREWSSRSSIFALRTIELECERNAATTALRHAEWQIDTFFMERLNSSIVVQAAGGATDQLSTIHGAAAPEPAAASSNAVPPSKTLAVLPLLDSLTQEVKRLKAAASSRRSPPRPPTAIAATQTPPAAFHASDASAESEHHVQFVTRLLQQQRDALRFSPSRYHRPHSESTTEAASSTNILTAAYLVIRETLGAGSASAMLNVVLDDSQLSEVEATELLVRELCLQICASRGAHGPSQRYNRAPAVQPQAVLHDQGRKVIIQGSVRESGPQVAERELRVPHPLLSTYR